MWSINQFGHICVNRTHYLVLLQAVYVFNGIAVQGQKNL